MSMESIKYTLSEDKIPKHWYNIQADLKQPAPPVLHPGTGNPIGPDDLAPLFPMELIGQEVSTEREIEIPSAVRDIYRQWRPTPLFRARPGAEARYAGAYLLQIRGGKPSWQPQAQYGRCPGLLQQAGRHQQACDRDRCWSIGAGDGGRLFWDGVSGVYGADQLRPKAISARPDRELWCAGLTQSGKTDRDRQGHSEGASRLVRLAGHSHFGGGGGCRQIGHDEVLSGQRFESCPDAPNGDWTGDTRTARNGR